MEIKSNSVFKISHSTISKNVFRSDIKRISLISEEFAEY